MRSPSEDREHTLDTAPRAGRRALAGPRSRRLAERRCRRRWLERSLVLLVLALGWPAGAGAGTLWSSGGDQVAGSTSDQGKASAYAAYMREADKNAIDAMEVKIARTLHRPRRPRAYQGLIDDAVRLYEKAAEVDPLAAEPHYRAAEVLHTHLLERIDGGPTILERDIAERAIAHWRAFEKLAPLDPRLSGMLDRRSIVYTRLATEADIEKAIVDYETLLRRSSEVDARWLGNLAESYMMVGRLDDALATYQRALEYSNSPLHGYGLAVALDRDGQGEQARHVMWSYSTGDRMRSLHSPGVFFVPAGEQFYYYALGAESMGELEQAAKYYAQFIASGAHPRYQPRARENLAALEKRLARSPRSAPRAAPGLPRGLGL